ncbi:MAG: NAD-dependent epimerase/dehydratase family protein [Fusobacteriota bacterium]
MKILITGATGIVGSKMVKEFLKKDHEVICLVRRNK